eukprot:5516193-Ditylum_brightwellii.AAC.1
MAASSHSPMHMVGRASMYDKDPDSITIGRELSKVKAQHVILLAMSVKCSVSTSGIKVRLARQSCVLEGALTSKGGQYEKVFSYKEQLQTYMGKYSKDTCDFLHCVVKAPTIVKAFVTLILSCQFKTSSVADNWDTIATEANILMLNPTYTVKNNNSKARAIEYTIMLEAMMGQHMSKRM